MNSYFLTELILCFTGVLYINFHHFYAQEDLVDFGQVHGSCIVLHMPSYWKLGIDGTVYKFLLFRLSILIIKE